jgi:hypothetical protein
MERRLTKRHQGKYVSALILGVLASGVAPIQAKPNTLRWERIALDPVSDSTQVVAATRIESAGSSPSWILGGATAARPPERKPAAWISTDLKSFVPISMSPNQGYGEIAEVFGIAGRGPDGGDLAAIAQAFGGAHGNPRTASWDGSASGGLSEIRTNFELYNGVRQISVKSIATNSNTYAIFGSRVSQNGRLGAASWTSPDGSEFTLFDNDEALSSAPNEQILGADIAVDPNGIFVAAGERLWWDPTNSAETIDTDAIIWRSANGQSWERWTPSGYTLGGKGEQRIQKIMFANGQLVAAGTETIGGKAWVTIWSPSGKHRVRELGSSDDPLSSVTSIAPCGGSWCVGVRMSGRLRLLMTASASSAAGAAGTPSSERQWRQVRLPSGLPSGGRAKIVVIATPSAERNELLVGTSGLESGGLWRALLPSSP